MNLAEAVRYNEVAAARSWRPSDLPDRFNWLWYARSFRQGDYHRKLVPHWHDAPDDLAQLAVGEDRWVFHCQCVFAQEVALFQMLHGLHATGCLDEPTSCMMRSQNPHPEIPIKGKGLWIWNETQLPKNHVAKAREANVDHVLIKVADYRAVHPYSVSKNDEMLALQLLDHLFRVYRNHGIQTIPWVYAGTYGPEVGKDEACRRVIQMADKHVELSKRFGADALIINAEKGFKTRYRSPDGIVEVPWAHEHAELYFGLMRRAGVALGLSSYFYTEGHGSFAWQAAMRGTDFWMPQIYWSVKERARNRMHYALWTALRSWMTKVDLNHNPPRPMLPSGGLYQSRRHEHGDYDRTMHKAEDIQGWIAAMNGLKVPATSMWWYMRPSDTNKGDDRVTLAQWNAFANVLWGSTIL